VLQDNSFGGHAALPCQAGLRPHSLMNCGRRLTTKGLAFGDFVAPRSAGVNGKYSLHSEIAPDRL